MRRLLFILIALALVGGAAFWLNQAPGSQAGHFSIEPGASAGQAARGLQGEGYIRSARWFLLLARLRGVTGRLQAGVYEIRRDQTAGKILQDIVSGRTRRLRVTVPEGWASWQIADRLDAAGVCAAADFRQAVSSAAAEGYLFPDTYFFEPGTPPVVVVVAMRARNTAALDALKVPSLEPVMIKGRRWTRHEIVTLASLIEREARKEEERALISAVFHNRLAKRMRLESDPTVQFSLGFWKDRILYRDLDNPSPYNTYRRFGLPPGPICSPGAASLAAALAPAPVDYLYFVADESGGHAFFTNYKDHLQGVKRRNQERRENKRRK